MGSGRRIGILGGTFDPLHVGHLVAAACARYECSLDEVWFMVANDPWQKRHRTDIAPAELRFAAVAAAVQGRAGLRACRLEIDRGGSTYTVDTLEELHRREPGTSWFLIQGADSAAGMPTWVGAARIPALAEVIVVDRPGAPWPQLPPPWRVHRAEMPALDISSTDLRERLQRGEPVDFLVPDAAVAVLRAGGLYPGGAGAVDGAGRSTRPDGGPERS